MNPLSCAITEPALLNRHSRQRSSVVIDARSVGLKACKASRKVAQKAQKWPVQQNPEVVTGRGGVHIGILIVHTTEYYNLFPTSEFSLYIQPSITTYSPHRNSHCIYNRVLQPIPHIGILIVYIKGTGEASPVRGRDWAGFKFAAVWAAA